MILILVKDSTHLKRRLAGADGLGEHEKVWLHRGVELIVLSYDSVRGHFFLVLAEPCLGELEWFIRSEHVILMGQIKQQGDRRQRILAVPFLQPSPETSPKGYGAVCMAMVLQFNRIGPRHRELYESFEEEIFDHMQSHGLAPHVPIDLSTALRDYGLPSNFHSNATIADIFKQIDQDQPAILHGYFTAPGHPIVVSGYDQSGFFIHDPHGEFRGAGYRRNTQQAAPGRKTHYSLETIKQACMPDGGIWAHLPLASIG